jgi:hypothetical protein
MQTLMAYRVLPCRNVPTGMARQEFLVLSPIWRGATLTIRFPDGVELLLTGRQRTGRPCDLRVFWTRHQPQAPAVCLVIGGTGGIRETGPPGSGQPSRGRPFLCLAESLIPEEVLAVIGPQPRPERLLLG